VAAITYTVLPTNSAVFLAVNAQYLASAYATIGYSTSATSFVSASINPGVPQAPASLVIPSTATNSQSVDAEQLPVITIHAIQDNGDIIN